MNSMGEKSGWNHRERNGLLSMYLFQKVCKCRTRLSLPGTQGEIITLSSCVFVGDGIELRVPLFPHHLDEPHIAQIVSHFFSVRPPPRRVGPCPRPPPAPPPAGSDQATRLVFRDYHPKVRCFQALNHYFHGPKCPFKVQEHPRLIGWLFLRRLFSSAKIAF